MLRCSVGCLASDVSPDCCDGVSAVRLVDGLFDAAAPRLVVMWEERSVEQPFAEVLQGGKPIVATRRDLPVWLLNVLLLVDWTAIVSVLAVATRLSSNGTVQGSGSVSKSATYLTRLETRTKESNMCASLRVVNLKAQ